MLDADFVKEIARLQAGASSPQPLGDEGDTRFKERFIVNGELLEIDQEPETRNHTVNDLASLLEAAEILADADGHIWHDHDAIRIRCSDGLRRDDQIKMNLTPSPQYDLLRRFTVAPGGQPTAISHAEMVNLIRYDLDGHVPETLLPVLRRIRVSGSSRADQEINPGRERGMQEFQRELADAEQMPDWVPVTFTVYSNPDLRDLFQTVRLGLDLNLEQLTFRVRTHPNELVAAEHATQAAIHDRLDQDKLTVFYGRPELSC